MDRGFGQLERRCRRVIALAGAALAMASLSSAAWAACSCTNLTVHHADAATVRICSNHYLNYPECVRAGGPANGCGGYTYAYTCPTGVNNGAVLEQQVGFGVDATVTGNSADCRSGQALQLTMTSNGMVDKPKVHPTPVGNITIGAFSVDIDNAANDEFPDVGTVTGGNVPYFGADTYTNPAANNLLISRDATHIKWWDNTDQAKDTAAEIATWKYRFFSYVTGDDANHSCGCVFDIDVDWPSNAPPVTTWTGDAVNSHNCTF